KCAWACATACFTCSGSFTSSGSARTASPKRCLRAPMSSTLRAVAATLSPRERAASAQIRPKPRDAPVINQVFMSVFLYPFLKALRELLRRRYCGHIFSPFKIGNQSCTRRTPPKPLLRLLAGTSQVHTGEPRKPAEMLFCRFRRSRYHPHVQPAADRFSDV